MNNSLLDIENTLNYGDCLAYLMTKAKDDSYSYICELNGFYDKSWIYQPINRDKLDKLFSHAPEGFTEFLINNGYLFITKNGRNYFLKSKLRKIISVNS